MDQGLRGPVVWDLPFLPVVDADYQREGETANPMLPGHEDTGRFRPGGPAAQVLPAPELVVRGGLLRVQAGKPCAFQRPNVTKDVSVQPLQQPDLPPAQAPQRLQLGEHPPAGRHPGLLQRQGAPLKKTCKYFPC